MSLGSAEINALYAVLNDNLDEAHSILGEFTIRELRELRENCSRLGRLCTDEIAQKIIESRPYND